MDFRAVTTDRVKLVVFGKDPVRAAIGERLEETLQSPTPVVLDAWVTPDALAFLDCGSEQVPGRVDLDRTPQAYRAETSLRSLRHDGDRLKDVGCPITEDLRSNEVGEGVPAVAFGIEGVEPDRPGHATAHARHGAVWGPDVGGAHPVRFTAQM